jgi:hypothetical protein
MSGAGQITNAPFNHVGPSHPVERHASAGGPWSVATQANDEQLVRDFADGGGTASHFTHRISTRAAENTTAISFWAPFKTPRGTPAPLQIATYIA